MDKVLVVGSGLTAPMSASWNLDGWTVVALHHGWQAVGDGRWDVFLHADDAPDDMKPHITRDGQKIVNTLKDYIYSKQYREYFTREFRRMSGVCRTIFLTGIWWSLHNLNPSVIGTIGCDMHYPGGANNTFYGMGTCDPLLHADTDMSMWLGFIAGYCHANNIELVNFSPEDSPSRLPFIRAAFQELEK